MAKNPTKKENSKSIKANYHQKQSLKKKIFSIALKAVLIGVAMFFLLAFLIYLGLFGRLPSEKDLKKVENQTASLVYSVDGKIMGGYYIQNRQTINNKNVAQCVKDALVATEDSRFFEHKGLDFISLGRVVFKTVLFGDLSQGGGSTISQQLAKNMFPRKDFGFMSIIVNKIREIFIASRLENVYSKEDILIMYLNTVPFGEDIYGIETASQRFFNKKSQFLNPAEAATLVGMLAANTSYNPRLNPERSKSRRDIVLQRMAEHKNITDEELAKWLKYPLKIDYKRVDRNTGIAPYFREKVRVSAEQILKEKYGDEYDLYSDGLKIYTSIDSRIQKYAYDAVIKHMERIQRDFDKQWSNSSPWRSNPALLTKAVRNSERYNLLKKEGKSDDEIMQIMEKPVRMSIYSGEIEKTVVLSPIDSVKHYLSMLNTGFFVIDPQNGYILAWVGGVNHKVFEYDHVTSRRQVGSTFKPFVYATALLHGVDPCEFISNEKRIYEGYNNWSPGNSNGDHDGYYSIKGGLANSVNTIAAELIMKTGVNDVVELAHNMGIKSDIPDYPSIALGTADLSLYEMVTAYSVFPNYGRSVTPVGILKIEDQDGKVLYQSESQVPEYGALDIDVCKTMVEMMKGVVERGTGSSLRTVYGLKTELAGKTGTTQDNTDGWFIGYTPSLVAGVWVGNDNPAIRFRTTGLGAGAVSALPVFALFMNRLEADPRFNKYTQSSFLPLPGYLATKFECEDFSLDDPNRSFFDRLFRGKNSIPESKTLKESTSTNKQNENEKPGLLEKMKWLFKKKKDD